MNNCDTIYIGEFFVAFYKDTIDTKNKREYLFIHSNSNFSEFLDLTKAFNSINTLEEYYKQELKKIVKNIMKFI